MCNGAANDKPKPHTNQEKFHVRLGTTKVSSGKLVIPPVYY